MQKARPVEKLFTVYGGEPTREQMGGKGAAIFNRQESILEIGFSLVERHILSMNFTNEFLKRCGAADAWARNASHDEIARLIDRGKFREGELKTLEGICKLLGNEPALAIRSSAYGDAKGTGAYKSFFAVNSPEAIEHYVKEVLKSHYSQRATQFRKSAGLAEGIAVMVEPLVSEKVSTGFGAGYAPRLSGNARMSSMWGDIIPQINAFEGLANLKDMDAGIKVELWDRWEPIKALIFDKDRVRNRMIKDYEAMGERAIENPSAKSFLLSTRVLVENGTIVETRPIWNYKVDFYHMNLNFDKMFDALLEYKKLGYHMEELEWAMRAEKGKPVYYINQASSCEGQRIVSWEVPGKKRIGGSVLTQGDGSVDAPILIRIDDAAGWAKIREINLANRNYMLLLDFDLFKSRWYPELFLKAGQIEGVKGIMFAPPDGEDADMGSSVGFIDTKHGHVQGQFEAMGKIVAAFQSFDWGAIEYARTKCEGYSIYRVDATLISSTSSNRAMLYVSE